MRLILFLAGALLGTLGDFAHVTSGTLAYPMSNVWHVPGSPQPIWVPFLMGLAGLSIGMWMRGPRRRKVASAKYAYAAPLTLVVAYAASGYIPLASGGFRDLVLAVFAAANWWFWDRTPEGALRAAGVAITGAAFEIAIISLGAFYYVSPNLFTIMSWIPWLYFTAASSLGAFVHWLEERNLQPQAA